MLKFATLALGLLIGTQTTALDLETMTNGERSAFRAEIRSYLMENPEVLMEAIGVLEQREQAATADSDESLVKSYAAELFNDGHSFIGGNPNGDITIVEFMDYRCGYCKKAFPEVEALITGDGNIRYIVKEFPILGEASLLASQFAIAVKIVAGDETYEAVHNTLMEFRGEMSQNNLNRLANNLDLEVAAINVEMGGSEVAKIINDNRLLGKSLQITGTPTFVVQDQMLRGYVPYEQMVRIVATVRQND